MIVGDDNIVNVIASHPSQLAVVASGIDNDVKLFVPSATDTEACERRLAQASTLALVVRIRHLILLFDMVPTVIRICLPCAGKHAAVAESAPFISLRCQHSVQHALADASRRERKTRRRCGKNSARE